MRAELQNKTGNDWTKNSNYKTRCKIIWKWTVFTDNTFPKCSRPKQEYLYTMCCTMCVCVSQSGETCPIHACEQLSPMRMSISYPVMILSWDVSLPLSFSLSAPPAEADGRPPSSLLLFEVSACKRQFFLFLFFFPRPVLPSACSWGKCCVSVNKLIKKYGLDLLNLESVMRWLLLWNTVWNVSAAGIESRKKHIFTQIN